MFVLSRMFFAMLGLISFSALAHADVTAICKLDKGTVTVAFTNPESKTMQCEVNCDMAIPNGIGTVVCVKPVPGGAKDLVLCTETKTGTPYTRVKGQDVNCRDPNGTPVTPEQQKAEEEDDEALGKKIQEQSMEMLRQLQRK